MLLPIIFWVSIGLILYTHFLYGLVTHGLSRFYWRPHFSASQWPRLTVVIAAYNEAGVIADTVRAISALDYPSDHLKVVVVTDGSTDNTRAELTALNQGNLTICHDPVRRGKAHAINRGVEAAQDEILVFTDANTYWHPAALKALVRHFADPDVGLVAGAKRVRVTTEASTASQESLYWRYESWLKRNDARIHSVVGAAGEIYAMRRSLYHPLAEGAILDDFILTVEVLKAGYRAVYEPTATSDEAPSFSLSDEFERKVRIVAGAYQALALLRPTRRKLGTVVMWQLVSHRLLRWMVAPFLFPLVFICNLFLLDGLLYQVTLCVQLLGYFLAWQGHRGQNSGLARAAFYYCFFQVAALAGAWRAARRTQTGIWTRVERHPGIASSS